MFVFFLHNIPQCPREIDDGYKQLMFIVNYCGKRYFIPVPLSAGSFGLKCKFPRVIPPCQCLCSSTYCKRLLSMPTEVGVSRLPWLPEERLAPHIGKVYSHLSTGPPCLGAGPVGSC